MTVALVTHPACIDHDPGPTHAERPARLRAVLAALDAPRFASLYRVAAREATADELRLVHSASHLRRIEQAAADTAGGARAVLDPDTAMSEGSLRAARLAAGGACRAVELVMEGKARAAFAAVRPPGHHAEPERAMGFCLFSNVAVAALHARRRYGVRRVAVLDFDVHHGNGTQAAAEHDPDFFFGSSHQMPLYPGTGDPAEHGISGNVVNAGLPEGADGAAFLAAWRVTILPALARFGPELVLVSAGFDAHRADPLAGLRVREGDFARVTRLILEAAGGRLVSVLEGGYDLEALAVSAAAHVDALLAD